MALAVILGGGLSRRMGTDKTQLRLADRTLLERAIDAVSFVDHVVVVAPETTLDPAPDWPRVSFALEDPPFGGPVAGIAAGIAHLSEEVDEEEIFLLPVDIPRVDEAIAQLAAADVHHDGVALVDEGGWPQFLLGRYLLGSLRRSIDALDTTRNIAVRTLGDQLRLDYVTVPSEIVQDVDTPEEAREAAIDVDLPARSGTSSSNGGANSKGRKRDDPQDMARLHDWQEILRETLGVTNAHFDQEQILDLASVIAKEVARPAVPVTGYIVGLAVGAALERGDDIEAVASEAFHLAMEPHRLLEQDGAEEAEERE